MLPLQLNEVSYLSCLKNGEYSCFLIKLDDRTKNMLGLSFLVAINTLALKHLVFPIVSLGVDISNYQYVKYIQAKDSKKSLLLLLPFSNFYVNYKEKEEFNKANGDFDQFVREFISQNQNLPLQEHRHFIQCLDNYKNQYSLVGLKTIAETLLKMPLIKRTQFIQNLLNLGIPKTEIESIATTLSGLENPSHILGLAVACPKTTKHHDLIQSLSQLLHQPKSEIFQSFDLNYFKNASGDFHYFIIKNCKNYKFLQIASEELKEEVIALARFYHDEAVLDGLREHHFIPEVISPGQPATELPIDVLTVIRPLLDSEDQLSLSLVSKTHCLSSKKGYFEQFQHVLLFLDSNNLIELDFYKEFVNQAFCLNKKLYIPESQKMIYRAKVILINNLKNLPQDRLSLLIENHDLFLSHVFSIAMLYKKYYPSANTLTPLITSS